MQSEWWRPLIPEKIGARGRLCTMLGVDLLVAAVPRARAVLYNDKKMMKQIRVLVLFVLFCLLFAGCFARRPAKYQGAREGGGPRPAASASESAQKMRLRLPWEIWPYDRDLRGQLVKSAAILQGDQELKTGTLEKALSEYQRARGDGTLPPAEREALTLRIASTQLALDQPGPALALVSDFFRAQGQTVEDVDPHFSLLLAYAYGRKGDLDQSLAWFSRVNRIAAGQGPLSDSAATGVRLLLRSVPDERFVTLRRQWAGDSFVFGIFGQEQLRRASGAPASTPAPGETPAAGSSFWAGTGEQKPEESGLQPGKQRIVALLPLSGQFAALGQTTKNGIEMAASNASDVKVEYRDVAGNAAAAVAAIRELATAGSPSVILGPLLSDAAGPAADAAREIHTPMLTFSKSETFRTGEGIFRLGVTAASQVASLLQACSRQLGMTRYALLFPENSTGRTFADAFRAKVAEMQLELMYEASYFEGDQSGLAAIAAELERRNVQGVFLPDSLAVATSLFGNVSDEVRKKMHLLGTATWDEPGKLVHSSAILDGAVFVSPFFNESGKSEIADFSSSYQSRYGKQPDFLAAQGFDAATMVLSALRRQVQEGLTFEQSFQRIETYDGLTGVMAVDTSGEVKRRFVVVQFKGGKRNDLAGIPAPSITFRGNERIGGEADAAR